MKEHCPTAHLLFIRTEVFRMDLDAPATLVERHEHCTGNVDWEMSQRLLRLLVELNRMGKTVLIATHDLGLIRATKAQVQARVLRIANRRIQLAGADL